MTDTVIPQPDDAAQQTEQAPAAPRPHRRNWEDRFQDRFNEVSTFLKPDKGFQPAAIVSGILLGTTALATPLLGTMVGAGLALGGGLFLLLKTSDILVDNAAAFGKKTNVPSMALGIGLGALTSMPELFVSGAAMMAGQPAVGIGNITGSNIANLLLILGGTAVLRKIESKGASWKFNAAAMCVSTAAFGAQMATGFLNPVAGVAMLGGLGYYLYKSYKISQQDDAPAEEKAKAVLHPAAMTAEEEKKTAEAFKKAAEEAEKEKNAPEMKAPKWLNIGWGLAGLAGLIGAASFVVSSAVAFSTAIGISPVVVGILAVAVGTSLPELMVNIKAAMKGDANMAIGNILGSNVFNLLGIGGLLALTGTALPPDLNPRATMLGLVNTVAFGASALLASAVMLKNKGTLTRKHGIIGLALYAAFTAANFLLGGDAPAPDAAATAAPVPPPVAKPF